jgi:hypothetical protein
MSEGSRGSEGRPLVGGSVGRRARFAQKVPVPVGLEKVLYLAARDPDLCKKLLEDRAGTIAALGVALRPSERAMLEAAPRAALETMIDRIETSNPRRRRFMNLVAAAATSLAAGTAAVGCDVDPGNAVSMGDTGDVDTDTDMDAGEDASADTDTEMVDTDTEIMDAGGARADITFKE